MKLTQYIAISIAIFSSIVISKVSIASTDRTLVDRSVLRLRSLYIVQNKANDYYNSGLRKSKSGDLQGALADYNQAIISDMYFSQAFNSRGIVKKKLNDFQGALSDYNMAIRVNSSYSFAYNNRGVLKEDLNDLQGALADYSQAIVLNPKYAKVYYNRGTLKGKKLKDLQGALADYNQAIALNYEDPFCYNDRGMTKYDLDDKQGAIADFRQASKLFKEQGDEENWKIAIQNIEKTENVITRNSQNNSSKNIVVADADGIHNKYNIEHYQEIVAKYKKIIENIKPGNINSLRDAIFSMEFEFNFGTAKNLPYPMQRELRKVISGGKERLKKLEESSKRKKYSHIN
jgi:tetratricopeptide (TPR) repeat protein